jgi:hypothetical protein
MASGVKNLNRGKKPSASATKGKASRKISPVKAPDNAIASEERLAALIVEAEAELSLIEPEIERLEAQVTQLNELKVKRQKLLTFKLSLQAINTNYAKINNDVNASLLSEKASLFQKTSNSNLNVTFANDLSSAQEQPRITLSQQQKQKGRGDFDATEAIRQAKRLVRASSLNYQLFQAIVAHGGVADTPLIKQYLLAQDVRQPGSGETFEAVALTSISSRINYLVRKGLLEADGRGAFISRFGWSHPPD